MLLGRFDDEPVFVSERYIFFDVSGPTFGTRIFVLDLRIPLQIYQGHIFNLNTKSHLAKFPGSVL